jgi:hypothetical protein
MSKNSLKYLVAGSKAVKLIDHIQVHTLLSGGGHYYGISWNENSLFILDRNAGQGDVVHVYDTMFNLVDTLDLGGSIDGHQILWHSSRLFITDTKHNGILVYDGESLSVENWTSYTYDVDHINSLSVLDDDHIIACHSYAKLNEERSSEFFKVNIETFEAKCVAALGNKVHNLCGNYCCDTHSGEILQIDDDYKIVKKLNLSKWVRGLDTTEDFIVVGGSERAVRAERHDNLPGTVWILTHDFEIVDEITIENLGQVCDIRVLDKKVSHNGLIFNY